jgi:RNA polymerase sigma-70 factor (ECF subfamily)
MMRSSHSDTRGDIAELSTLLQRAGRDGDASAFAALHARTRIKMRKTVRAVVPTAAEIDDVLQDGYLKIWRHAASFDPARASPITWMCTIMRNTAVDAMRSAGAPMSELDEALAVPIPPETDEFDYALAEPVAREALQRLPPERRQLLALAYLEGESRSRLSQRFGVPVGTIKTWLHRSLVAVRKDCLGATAAMGAATA